MKKNEIRILIRNCPYRDRKLSPTQEEDCLSTVVNAPEPSRDEHGGVSYGRARRVGERTRRARPQGRVRTLGCGICCTWCATVLVQGRACNASGQAEGGSDRSAQAHSGTARSDCPRSRARAPRASGAGRSRRNCAIGAPAAQDTAGDAALCLLHPACLLFAAWRNAAHHCVSPRRSTYHVDARRRTARR